MGLSGRVSGAARRGSKELGEAGASKMSSEWKSLGIAVSNWSTIPQGVQHPFPGGEVPGTIK